MVRKREADVLVAGAGPVGLFCALEFRRKAVDVAILDAQWRTSAHSYALALHPLTLEVLDGAGIARDVVAKGLRVPGMTIYDEAGERARILFSELDSDFPYLLVLPQSDLEGLLEARLRDLGVRVGWSNSVDRLDLSGDLPRVRVNRLGKSSGGYAAAGTEWVVEGEYDWTAAFVVGADGHASSVRRQLGLDLVPSSPPLRFAVFEFDVDGDPGDAVRVSLLPDTTNVLWPLPGGRARFAFEIGDGAEGTAEREKSRLAIGGFRYRRLDRERLLSLIGERAPWFTETVGEIRWSLAVGFLPGAVPQFGRGRVWLAGDAAHVAPPMSVLSMNVGLREGRDLSLRLSSILRGGSGLEVLEEYGRHRTEEWEVLLSEGTGLRAGAGADDWVRANAARIAACLPACGPDRNALAAQIGLEPA